MLIYKVCRGCELLGQEPLGAPLAEADGEDHTKVSENKHSREMHVDIDQSKAVDYLKVSAECEQRLLPNPNVLRKPGDECVSS